jgi:hypothetical protein
MQIHDMKIKITSDLKTWLVSRAKRNNRTMQGEITQMFQDAQEQDIKFGKAKPQQNAAKQ